MADQSLPTTPARTLVDWLVAIALAAAGVLLASQFWFVCDDAFISLRYAGNWQRGDGFGFNPGEAPPVEGYSNFLWTAMLAGMFRAGVDPLVWAPRVSAACGAVLVAWTYLAARRAARRGPALLAVGFLLTSPSIVIWSSGGLETMPLALLLFAAFDRLWHGQSTGAMLATGLLAAGVALIRVEGLAWVAVVAGLFALAQARHDPRWRRKLAVLLSTVLAVYAAYFAWRYSVYETLLSNTAVAKGGLSAERLWRGLCYVAMQFLTQLPLFLLIPATLAALGRAQRGRLLSVAALAWAFPAYAVLVGGDFMAFGRFLVPMFPFVALLIAPLVQTAFAAAAAQRAAVVGIALLCIGLNLGPLWDLHLVPQPLRAALHFRHNSPEYRSEIDQWRFQKRNAAEFALKGRVLARVIRPGDSITEAAIGAVGYYSRRFVFDQVGLVTPIVAQRPLAADERQRSPGHDKWVEPEWFVARGITPTIAASLLIDGPLASAADRARLAQAFAAWQRRLRESALLAPRYRADFALFRLSSETAPRALLIWELADRPAPARGPAERMRNFVEGQSVEIIEGLSSD